MFLQVGIHASDPFVYKGFLSLHGVVFDIFSWGRDRVLLWSGKSFTLLRQGSNSVSERMTRSGLTVESAGRPSPCTSIQIA